MKLQNEPAKTTSQTAHLLRPSLGNYLFSPHSSIMDITELRKAQLSIALAFVLTATNIASLFFIDRKGPITTYYLQIILAIVTLIGYFLSRRPRFIFGSVLLITSLALSGFANVLSGSDNPTSALYLTVPIAALIGSALLPVWGNVVLVVGGLIGTVSLPLVYPPYTWGNAISNSVFLFTFGILLIVVQVFRNNVERENLQRVEAINRDLRELGANLEQRVADRTKALATSSDVSRRLSTILDRRELVNEVVNQVRNAFGYYHTQIYFYDEAHENLVMAGGTGEAGEKMLAQFHKITKGRGLVGRAAETNEPILVSDTASNSDWLPNTLLPETKSEVAIPISIGDEVLGVLDVQHNIVDGLKREDIDALQSISNQVAVAVQNARSYTEVQRSQALLSDALKAARLGNWEYDFVNDLFLFTDDFYSIFRTNVERVGGYKISSADYSKNFVHPDDAALVGIEIQRVLDAKDRLFTTHLEHRIIFADGEIGYIAVNINVERDEDGQITRWYGANQDVTERRRLEEFNRKRATQQEAINVITKKIQSATSIETALQVAARELGHALGMKPTVVTLEPEALANGQKGTHNG